MIAEAALAVLAYTAPAPCTDHLALVLHSAGFRANRIRIAWAIAMRESKGNPAAVSPRNADYGLFQFNRAAWSKAEWWNPARLIDPVYNARVAYKLSQGGRTWYPWDISGRGEHLGRYSSGSTFRVFVRYLAEYPCVGKSWPS